MCASRALLFESSAAELGRWTATDISFRTRMTHPYAKHENTPLWVLLDAGLAELEANGDVELTAAREYVIGTLCEHTSMLFGWLDGTTLRAWRTLRAADWPKNATEVQRFEIAQGIDGVIRSGTAEHVADALRSLAPRNDGKLRSIEEVRGIAQLLVAAESLGLAAEEND